MEAYDIEQIIVDTFSGNNNHGSILINGGWGCGKTTLVKEAIDCLKERNLFNRRKVIYVSLFGLRDIAQLTPCFSKARRNFKRIGKVIGPFFAFIPIVGSAISRIALDSLEYVKEETSKIKKGCTFIFDDLERVDKNFSYITLLGLFNNIRIRGSKVICISSTNVLSESVDDEDKKRFKEFSNFSEKAFDKIYEINVTPVEAIESYFKELGFDTVGDRTECFDGNIRIAKRVARLYRSIKDNFSNNEEKDEIGILSVYSKTALLDACIFVIRVLYSRGYKTKDASEKNQPFFGGKDIPKHVAINWQEEFIDAKNTYLKNDDQLSFAKLALAILRYEMFEEKEQLIALCKKISANSESDTSKRLNPIDSFLDKNFILLSDSDKEKYFSIFKELIRNKDVKISTAIINKLFSILQDSNYTLSEKDIDLLADKMIEYERDKNNSSIFNYFSVQNELLKQNGNDLLDGIYKTLLDKYENSEADDIILRIKKCHEEKDYASLCNFIDIIESKSYLSHNDKVLNFIVQNSLLLPDLSSTLTNDEWQYCNLVISYCNKRKISNKVFDILVTQYNNCKNSKTAIARIRDLGRRLPSKLAALLYDMLSNK